METHSLSLALSPQTLPGPGLDLNLAHDLSPGYRCQILHGIHCGLLFQRLWGPMGPPTALASPAFWYFFRKEANITYLFIFREKERKGEREGKKHLRERETSSVAFCMYSDWGLNPQLRHVPSMELNQQPLALGNDAQPTKPH